MAELKEPMSGNKWCFWKLDEIEDISIDDLPLESPSNNNFEDHLRHCAKIDTHVSKVSSDIELKEACKPKNQELRSTMLSLFSDHDTGNDKNSEIAMKKFQDLKETCSMIYKHDSKS